MSSRPGRLVERAAPAVALALLGWPRTGRTRRAGVAHSIVTRGIEGGCEVGRSAT